MFLPTFSWWRICLVFLELSDGLDDLNFFNQKKKKKKPKKVFENDIEEGVKVCHNPTTTSCLSLPVWSIDISTSCSTSAVPLLFLNHIHMLMAHPVLTCRCSKSGAENRRRANRNAGGWQLGPDASYQKEEAKESGLWWGRDTGERWRWE